MDRKGKIIALVVGTVIIAAILGGLWYTSDRTRTLGVSKTIDSGFNNMMLADEKGNIKTLLFPAGIIVLWSGSLASVPDGWGLCDGTNGTPDLRGRFVVGTNPNANVNSLLSVYETGATGGAEVVTLTVDQMPSHSHSVSGNAARFQEGGSKGPGTDRWYDGQPVTTGGVGGNQPHENRPPYYSLAYIMKLRD
jgi:microcystin-dependent protein